MLQLQVVLDIFHIHIVPRLLVYGWQYILSQVRFMSLEKEVFPFMAQDGQLFAFDLEGTIQCIYM